MNLQQTRLALVLSEVGVELAVKSFDQRLVLQKAIHLLQEGGVQLGYHFRWYLRGPYSPRLTEDVFALANLEGSGATELEDWKLDEASLNLVGRFKSLFQGRVGHALAKHLELLSSVLFLVRTGQGQATNPAAITATLHKYGKQFSQEQVVQGIAMLRQHGFAF